LIFINPLLSDKHDEIFERSRQEGTYYKTSLIEEFVEKLISHEKLMPIEILHSSQDFVLTGILAFLFHVRPAGLEETKHK
jgi:hypothetical protein